ncbi:MAG: ABC transporter ATP-binding protein [Bacteroidia bacterium]|nr:ABC transporter ATP-binding protein [Bacteroidia bacterium]
MPKSNLELQAGEFICLLGANGSGKSTLLRTIAGVQNPLQGHIRLQNQDMNKLWRTHRAQQLSLVLTEAIHVGNFSVYDLVSLGRYPYTGWMGQLSRRDRDTIDWALQVTDTQRLASRNVYKLSDGERQRVMIARALAQDTPLILLDEPTAHLDLPNRVMVFKLLRQLAREARKAILLSTHELDLALQVSDKLWLIPDNSLGPRPILQGAPEDMVLSGTFEQAFPQEGFNFDKFTGSFKIDQPKQRKIKLIGQGVQAFWTTRALERQGFAISQNGDNTPCIELAGNSQHNYRWIATLRDKQSEHRSIEHLLHTLHQEFYENQENTH